MNRKELKNQIKKIESSIKILDKVEKNIDLYDSQSMKIVLLDLITGYRAVLKGMKINYEGSK